jgi:hypothetical protein
MVSKVNNPSDLSVPDKLTQDNIGVILSQWKSVDDWSHLQGIGVKDNNLQVYITDKPSNFSLFNWFKNHNVNLDPISAKKISDNYVVPNIEDTTSIPDSGLSSLVKKVEKKPIISTSLNTDSPQNSLPEPIKVSMSDEEDISTSILDEDGNDVPAPEMLEVVLKSETQGDIPVFTGRPVLVGRVSGKVPVVIKDSHISRIHAKLMVINNQLTVTDLYSTNGTFLNGIRLDSSKAYPVTDGDVVSFSKFDYKVSYEG